jgi:hypothetical protein
MRSIGHSKVFASDEELGGVFASNRKADHENFMRHISLDPIDTRKLSFSVSIGEASEPVAEVIEFDERMESCCTSNLNAQKHVYEDDIEKATFDFSVYPPTFVGEGVTNYEKMQHSIVYAPTFNIIDMLRENDSVVKFKRTSIAFDVYGAIAVFLFQCSIFMTRASVYRTYYLNSYFSCAFTFAYLSVGTLVILIGIIVLERVTDPLQQKRTANPATKRIRRDSALSIDSNYNDREKDYDQSACTSMNKSVISARKYIGRDLYDIESKREEKRSAGSERTATGSPQHTELNKRLNKIINHWVFQEAFDGMAILTSVAIGENWNL